MVRAVLAGCYNENTMLVGEYEGQGLYLVITLQNRCYPIVQYSSTSMTCVSSLGLIPHDAQRTAPRKSNSFLHGQWRLNHQALHIFNSAELNQPRLSHVSGRQRAMAKGYSALMYIPGPFRD